MPYFKHSILILFLFVFNFTFSQTRKTAVFGEPTSEDFEINSYHQDPEAAGIVLFESAKNYVELVDNQVKLIKEVHVKTKVFDISKFDQATVKIPFYNKKNNSEKVTKITAITHNGAAKTFVSDKDIFTTDETPKWSIKKFTFPNIQNGSILEYTYRVESTYFSNIRGWKFQGPLPKLYVELYTDIPGNFKYNRTLYGNLPLYINDAIKSKACFSIEGFDVHADCEKATYAMINVPAVKEEKFMLSPDNYLASMKYELIEFVDFNRTVHRYTNEWKDVDKHFQYDKDYGRQLKHSKFFKNELPASLFSKQDKVEKAKDIYYYIQSNMNWNGRYGYSEEVRVKDAFNEKSGNSHEINFALYNALDAAGLNVNTMLISTRDYALPTKQYPVIADFIYAIVVLEIEGNKYFLDATDKFTPFGVLPFRALSTEGRLMDFNKGSYWEKIIPFNKNLHYVNMQLTADESGLFTGKASQVSTGYVSVVERKEYNDYRKDIIDRKKQSRNENLEISDLKIENEKDLDKPYKETFNLALHEQPIADNLFLYPFLMETYFGENPFVKRERIFPIDFGFPVMNNYLIAIDVNDQYKIEKVPANKILKLPENDGEFSVVYDISGSKINIRLSVKLNNPSFAPEAYKSLQEFFTELIKVQNEEPIHLKRI